MRTFVIRDRVWTVHAQRSGRWQPSRLFQRGWWGVNALWVMIVITRRPVHPWARS